MVYQFSKNSVVSRSFYICKATALKFKGFQDGAPVMETVESESYVTTNPNDKPSAKRMIKRADKSVLLDTLTVEVIATEVVAMSNEDFILNGHVVDRAANGRVK